MSKFFSVANADLQNEIFCQTHQIIKYLAMQYYLVNRNMNQLCDLGIPNRYVYSIATCISFQTNIYRILCIDKELNPINLNACQ